jgi:hypothetical protein
LLQCSDSDSTPTQLYLAALWPLGPGCGDCLLQCSDSDSSLYSFSFFLFPYSLQNAPYPTGAPPPRAGGGGGGGT